MPLFSHKSNLGVLRLIATNQTLDYRAYEVSSCTLGIISKDLLSPRDYLMLESSSRRIPFRVIESKVQESTPLKGSHPPPQAKEDIRYRLVCLDAEIQLDSVFMQEIAEGPRPNFQFARFAINPKLYIEAFHPISQSTELFESVNISRSGLLLRTHGPGSKVENFPHKSHLQLRLDVAHLWLPRVIEPKCIVARSYMQKLDGQLFGFLGVQFSWFSVHDGLMWHELLNRMERSQITGSECVRPERDLSK